MSSQTSTSVGFAFDFTDNQPGPGQTYRGNLFTINFVNGTANTATTKGTSFDYDVSSIAPGGSITNGSSSGTVSPGQTVAVSFFLGAQAIANNEPAAGYAIQNGAAPLISNLEGGTVCFWFFTNGSDTNYQQIAICNNEQSSFPISSTPVQTSTQMVCTSASTGLSITLDGGGNSPLTTSTIFIEIGSN